MRIHVEGSRLVYLLQPAGLVGQVTPQYRTILFDGHWVIAHMIAQIEAGISRVTCPAITRGE